MAQLKDLLVNGASHLIGDVFTNKIQITSLHAPTTAGGTTYGAGTNGQVLKSNGTNVYWAADNNAGGTVTSITLIAGTGISLDTNNTAITTSGSRTITNTGVTGVKGESESTYHTGQVNITDHSYTPAGSVSVTPTVTVNTTTVNSITAVGELPSLSMTVTNEVLSFTWAAGSLPTKGNDTTVATGIKTATATASFSGTAATLSHTVA